MFLAKRNINLLLSLNIFKIKKDYHVTVVGGAGEIGQTLCMMLRDEPSVTKLTVHDTQAQTPGVIMDLSHIPTNGNLKGFTGLETLDKALQKTDLVIAAGGTTLKPGVSRKAFVHANTDFIKTLSARLARISPMPFVGIMTEPINSLVPMAAEIMRNQGHYDPKRLFGITCIDAIRAVTLYATEHQADPSNCFVPVIGGHSTSTLIPLLSQATPVCKASKKNVQELSARIRHSEDTITEAKKGYAPTLSVAYGALVFTRAMLAVLDGKKVELHAFVENNDFGTSFFAGLVNVDKNGAGEMRRYTNLSGYECDLIERGTYQLRKEVLHGKRILEFA